MCCGGGNLNLEEKRRENETWIKVRALGGLWCLFRQTNFKILKISGDRVKILVPTDKRDISKISQFRVQQINTISQASNQEGIASISKLHRGHRSVNWQQGVQSVPLRPVELALQSGNGGMFRDPDCPGRSRALSDSHYGWLGL